MFCNLIHFRGEWGHVWIPLRVDMALWVASSSHFSLPPVVIEWNEHGESFTACLWGVRVNFNVRVCVWNDCCLYLSRQWCLWALCVSLKTEYFWHAFIFAQYMYMYLYLQRSNDCEFLNFCWGGPWLGKEPFVLKYTCTCTFCCSLTSSVLVVTIHGVQCVYVCLARLPKELCRPEDLAVMLGTQVSVPTA